MSQLIVHMYNKIAITKYRTRFSGCSDKAIFAGTKRRHIKRVSTEKTMSRQRKNFRRGSEEERRLDLIQATQVCIVEGGIRRATVRRIAEQAGVTPGLIRHYFPGKDELLCETYRYTMSEMTQYSVQAVQEESSSAVERLHLFVRTTLSAPVMSPRQHQLWASFTSLIRSMPALAQVHRESYLEFRQECSKLVADVLREKNRPHKPREVEQLAIAVNAVLDGLWLEGCLAVDLFDVGEVAVIGVRSVDDLLGLP